MGKRERLRRLEDLVDALFLRVEELEDRLEGHNAPQVGLGAEEIAHPETDDSDEVSVAVEDGSSAVPADEPRVYEVIQTVGIITTMYCAADDTLMCSIAEPHWMTYYENYPADVRLRYANGGEAKLNAWFDSKKREVVFRIDAKNGSGRVSGPLVSFRVIVPVCSHEDRCAVIDAVVRRDDASGHPYASAVGVALCRYERYDRV